MVAANDKTTSIPVKDRAEKLQEVRSQKSEASGQKPVDPIWENGKALGLTENSIRVLMSRYLKKGPDGKCFETPEELFRRVASTVASAEAKYGAKPAEVKRYEKAYFDLMVSGVYMPNSPTLMNAGREMGMLSACFVLPLGDSIHEIFDTVKATALIQKAGGGTGFTMDRLRPTGDWIKSSGGTTSGPISFWKVLSEATNAIQQGAFRRGANMMMLTITMPDILKFIFAKQDLSRFQNYNISVKVPDAWMEAYRTDPKQPNVVSNPRTKKCYVLQKDLNIEQYQLNDLLALDDYNALPSDARPAVWRMCDIWDTIVNNAWQTGEPGIVFIDRISQANPTPNVGEMEATNPCGEQPLLPYEACNLGSINLGVFCGTGFQPAQNGQAGSLHHKNYDWDGLRKAVHLSTRFLENVVEVNNYVIPEIEKVCKTNRKIGLGIMGFADALYKMGIGYNTPEGVAWGEKFMQFVNDEAHNESERLANERGCFANWPGSRWETTWKRKQRNACSTTVAPTGTISIISNCSGGIEPLFSLAFFRHVMRDHKGQAQQMVEVNDVFKAVAKASNYWGYGEQELFDRIATEGTLHHIPNIPDDVKSVFVCAHDITPDWHVKMQAAFQKHCDSSISKTTNFPNDATPDDVRQIYDLAFETGCKGVTVYRDGCRKGQPMALKKTEEKPCGAGTLPAPVKEIVKEIVRETVSVKPQRTPSILSAVRIRSNTPFGHMHLTISVDPKSERELEVFAQLGKAGDIAASDLEAICRMVSLFLRCGGSMDLVIDQLEGIGSSLSIPTKDGRVMSLGDALGKTIRKYWSAKKQVGLKAILLGEVDFDTVILANGNGNGNGNGHGNGHGHGNGNGHPHDAHTSGTHVPVLITPPKTTIKEDLMSNYKLKCPTCDNGTLAFMEGCMKCVACGYSKC